MRRDGGLTHTQTHTHRNSVGKSALELCTLISSLPRVCVCKFATQKGAERRGKARGSCTLKLLSLIKFSINFYPFFFVSFSLQFNRQTEVAARSGSANVQRKYKVAKQEQQEQK